MANLNLNQITNTFQHLVFQTEKDAMKCAREEFNWNEKHITQDSDIICLEVNGEIKDIKLNHLYKDSGSSDYLYFLN